MAIATGNYIKSIWLRWIIEISSIRWKTDPKLPARSALHDHSVAELTIKLWGRIYEIRNGIKTYHAWWPFLWVPKGTWHEVGVDKQDGPAWTINICFGILFMKTGPSTNIE